MSKNIAFWFAMISALLFGAATPVSKQLLGSLTSFQLAGLLSLGACVGISGLVIRDRKLLAPWRMDRINALRLTGSVMFGGILGPVLLLAGLQLASAASVSMWLNLEMVATAVLGHFVFKDHMTPRSWLAAGGIFFAAVMLAAGEGLAGLQAGVFVALACLCWGFDNHLTALIDGITPAQSTFWKGLVAGTTNLLIGLSLTPFLGSGWDLIGGLLVGVFAYGFSMVFYVTSAQLLGATRSQLIFSFAPFWGVLLSAILLGEHFTWYQVLAGVVFVGSVYLLFQEQHQHSHAHNGQSHDHFHAHDVHHLHHDETEKHGWHRHPHIHESISHGHSHAPDLHHRHLHVG